MADNLGITTGAGGPVATRDEGGVHHQKMLMEYDNGGTSVIVSTSNKMPVDDADTQVLLGAVNETAPASDTASSGLNGRAQRIAQRLTSLIALLPASLGQKAKTASLAVTLASDEDILARLGTVTETAPASDTASSGLNGRLQRIAQRITSLIALLPASLGQKTMDNSLAVAIASDQTPVPVLTVTSKTERLAFSGALLGASATTYASGDAVGSKFSLSNVLGDSSSNYAGYIDSIQLNLYAVTTLTDVELLIFDTNPSTSVIDNANITFTQSEWETLCASVRFNDADFIADGGGNYTLTMPVNKLVYGNASSSLYGVFVARGALDFTGNQGASAAFIITKG